MLERGGGARVIQGGALGGGEEHGCSGPWCVGGGGG